MKPKKSKPERLDDILFAQGFGTRRECAGLIDQGFVRVLGGSGGTVVTDPSEAFEAEHLAIEVEGRPWVCHTQALVLLHKPAGYECSQKPSAWPSVMLLLPAALRRRGVQPVGRLDQDTTGLLLLTDDGALIHRFTSPKKQVPKVYEIQTDRPVDAQQVRQLLTGVVLDDDPRPVLAEACEITGPQAMRMTLVQGKYHQVKRMVAAVGNHVVGLHRSEFGQLKLPADLAPGQWTWVEGPQAITG